MGAGKGNGQFPNTQGGSHGKPYKGERKPDHDFRNKKGNDTLDGHLRDHNHQLNVTSKDDYLNLARNFLEKAPTSSTQSFVSGEGTYFRYDTVTNEFGIINKYGGISTYFKPDDGFQYWVEQISKYAAKGGQ